jgi:ComF family protein
VLINNHLVPNIVTDLFDLFFPPACINCKELLQIKGKYLCFDCLSELPLTHFSSQTGNELEASFRGRIPVYGATSLFYFQKKGVVQKLIHELKYHHQPKIGSFLGKWLGEEMVASKRFELIDIVIPVPLHRDKERKRGYNQVHSFAKSLSVSLKADLHVNLLEKIRSGQTQTLKNREQRMIIGEQEYLLKDSMLLENKHVLLVDDTITTGATMQACADPLSDVAGLKLSLASIAFTA